MVGFDNVASLARDAGIKSARGTPAMAIGAYDATPLEMAGAYTVFANDGVHIDPWMLASVRAPNGDVIADYTPQTKPGPRSPRRLPHRQHDGAGPQQSARHRRRRPQHGLHLARRRQNRNLPRRLVSPASPPTSSASSGSATTTTPTSSRSSASSMPKARAPPVPSGQTS